MGFGFIGSEVSASLRQLGVEVVGHRRLTRAAGPGSWATRSARCSPTSIAEKGVALLTEDSVAALEGSGRVERVRTKRTGVFECDFVVAGIGIVPNTELLAAAGAQVDNGVLVDERCRNVASGRLRRGRRDQPLAPDLRPPARRALEQRLPAGARRGPLAGGRNAAYDYIHTFWSDQYEHVIEYVGFAASWDRLVFRGRPESRKFLGFYLKDGLVRAGGRLDRGGDPEDPKGDSELKAAVDMVRGRAKIDPSKLARRKRRPALLAGTRA